MTFDLIITTYNRPAEVFSLVCQALECNPAPEKVIVVDSSDEVHTNLLGIAGVWYIRSSHKNQPYQRLLGATAATSDIVVFFDDDLTITNSNIFTLILNAYQDKTVVGASVAIDYHSSISSNLTEAIILTTNKKWVSWFWKFTGVTFPKSGKVGRFGIVGPKPSKRQAVEHFHGPCMSFRRSIVKDIIPEDLLAQTEIKLSMGEDKVISMLSLRFGKLVFEPILCLYHPPNQSTYFSDIRLFIAKTIYSRLYLSKIYADIYKRPFYIEMIIFYWFTLWRLFIALISLLFMPSQSRKDKVLGTWDGLILSITLPQRSEKLTPDINWEAEIQKDLTSAKHATGSI